MSQLLPSIPTGASLKRGAVLPPLMIQVEARHVIMGAAASRDWQSQHHDHTHAVGVMGLPGIILNTSTQAGWLSRYATDWSGSHGRLGRMRFRMRKPVCPSDRITLEGYVSELERAEQGWWWVWLALALRRDEDIVTSAKLLLALPGECGSNPWQVAPADWQPPSLRAGF